MPTSQQIHQAIGTVNNRQSFIQNLLVNTLGWQIPQGIEQIEDIFFGWTQEELGADDLNQHLMDGQVFQIRPMSENQPWGIFILEFQNENVFTTGRGLTGPLRKVLRGLVPKRRRQANHPTWDKENLLFVCTYNYEHFRFAYFKSPKEKGHAEPLTMFGWSPDTPARTVCEFNLPHLVWPAEPENAESWVAHWAKAFDVEAVTKRFYDDYERVFTNLQEVLNLPTPEDKKMFAQVLMNRLMFLRFVERKGWLILGNSNPKEYLKNLYQARGLNNLSWYRSRLQVLFFEGLAIPNHNRENVIGSVPYLNGGLFTITEWDERAGDIADEVFEPILGEEGLLYRYNFTVEESTPLDIEVAVDPEMLGKVFEKLVTTRRQKGSYYTPRTVVSFMCREALKGYLGSQYAHLVDEHKTDNISVPEARDLLGRLDDVKILDPACGSGAYLLGMLQELFTLTEKLDTRAQTDDPHNAYQRKLNIIHNNIYGVDSDEFAVSIARLRLWLSLAVDFEGAHPDPLPNLDYKIEIGDSLTAPDPSGEFPTTFDKLARIKKIEKFDLLKAEYMDPRRRAEHPGLEDEIKQVRQEIFSFTHPNQQIKGFDWRVEFAEVWSQKNGFDIAIANPPYGINVDDFVRNMYFNQRNENEKGQSKDSYGIFIARGLQLLRTSGIMSYIVSDTWRTIKSHRPLRKRLLETTTVFHVLDLPPWIFDATVNTGIITLQKSQAAQDHKLIAGDLRGIEKGDWKTLSDNLIAVSGHGPDIQTINCARYTYKQSILSIFEYVPFFISSPKLFLLMKSSEHQDNQNHINVEFNGGLLKLTRVKFLIEEMCGGVKTYNDKKYIRNISGNMGYDILPPSLIISRQLTDEEKMRGIVVNNHSTDPHFIRYDKGGETIRPDGGLFQYYKPIEFFIKWDTKSVREIDEQNGLRNRHRYFSEGIGVSTVGIYSPVFRFSEFDVFFNNYNIIFVEPSIRLAIIGVFCSRVFRYMLSNYENHTVAKNQIDILDTPVPVNFNTPSLNSLVGIVVVNLKQNIDYDYLRNEQTIVENEVYKLYGLTEDDIREIELWYCRKYTKLAEAQGLLAEVREKYASHLDRCRRILEKPPSYWRSNPILQLIAQGESHSLEFKETLEYDTRQNQRSDDILKSSLKTIAGFLNSDGGTLLIGVTDTGEIKGIERDLRLLPTAQRNYDRFEQKIRNCLRDRFTPSPIGKIAISFEELAEGAVCRVDVQKSNDIIHFDGDIYVRDGNKTQKLEGPALTNWIQQRAN